MNGTSPNLPACEAIAELLPDYLQSALPHKAQDRVEQHLRGCADCRESVAMWNRLALLPQEQPSAHLRDRFQAMLHAYQEARREVPPVPRAAKVIPFLSSVSWQRWAAVAACAVLLLGGGFAAGRRSGNAADSADGRGDVAALRTELADMRQLVVLSMLQQQSAGDRLQGIAYTTQQGRLDPQVLNALLSALRSDANVDVRLAALDALSRHGQQPQVQEGIAGALQPQQSPLVQVALINQIVESRDRDARRQLLQIKQDPKLHPVVRQRVDWALSHLN